MNGAAMNCRQDPGVRPQHQDSSSLHNPGYHLQINRQQNYQEQTSKTLNYPSFSTNYQVDGFYNSLYQYENTDSRHSIREVKDPRFQKPRTVKKMNEPIDLPVPQFEIDEYSVTDIWNGNNDLIKESKGLDLDTRIGLLIKSKALEGMHPIFSDLNVSEESESDLEDPYLSRPRSKLLKKNKSKSVHFLPRDLETPIRESFDDPEKPLSRPPSPFLSRAKYLFWFNKAIEIKQQAKAQEQALLEQATKRLIQDNSPSLKTNQLDMPSLKRPILESLMNEISKELKEVIKQAFIREVIEQAAFNTLDDWWEKQNQEEKNDDLKNEPELLKKGNDVAIENYQDSCIGSMESQRSTSPKMPFPWKRDLQQQTKLFQEEDNFHRTCFEKTKQNESARKNPEENVDSVNPVVGDKITTSNNNSVILEDPEIQPDEIHQETCCDNIQKNCKIINHNGCCLVKFQNSKIDNSARKTHEESLNLLNAETSRPSTTDILFERNEVSQFPSSSANDPVDKFIIVKDVLDFIFSKVNTILVKRNDDKTFQKKENNNLFDQNHLNYTNSGDSAVAEH